MDRSEMTPARVREVLRGLLEGKFAVPARMLLEVLPRSEKGVLSAAGGMCSVRDLRSTYALRSRRLREQGRVFPGYEDVAAFPATAADDEKVMIVSIYPDDRASAGVGVAGCLFVSGEGAAICCFCTDGEEGTRDRAGRATVE